MFLASKWTPLANPRCSTPPPPTHTHIYMIPHSKRGHACETSVSMYIKERTIFASSHSKWGQIHEQACMQNIAMKLVLLYTSHGQSVDHYNRPQSEETNFVLGLSKCPHFDGVIGTLVLALILTLCFALPIQTQLPSNIASPALSAGQSEKNGPGFCHFFWFFAFPSRFYITSPFLAQVFPLFCNFCPFFQFLPNFFVESGTAPYIPLPLAIPLPLSI